MKTNKITLASNNLKINKTKQNKRNNTNLSFKSNKLFAPQNGQKVVQSVWNKLFPKLQKGLVKTIYKDLTPISEDKFTSDEIKYYFRKSENNLLLKTVKNCTLNKNKQIEKASEICYHYDTSEKGGLQQKIIINPEFDINNQLKKADCIYNFYNQDDEKRAVIHKGVEFKDDSIISSRSSEFIYNDGTKDFYKDTLINEDGEIYSFAKRESSLSYKEDNKSITQKKIWFDSNFTENTPDAYISTVNEPGKPEKKIYIEDPVFRDDNSIQSSRLGLKVTDGTAYTYYNSTYNEDGCIESSELSRVTNIDSYKKAQKLKNTLSSFYYPLLATRFVQIKKLEDRQQELSKKYVELEKQYQYEYELRIQDKRKTSHTRTIEPEQQTLGIKDLLKIYDNKSDNKEQGASSVTTQQTQISHRIKDLLKIYDNKSDNKEQESPALTTQQTQISPNIEENKIIEKEETKSTAKTILESMKSIEKEKEELQIKIAQLKSMHRASREQSYIISDNLNELMSQDIVYDREKDKKIIAKVSASFNNTIKEKFQFHHKELIENE